VESDASSGIDVAASQLARQLPLLLEKLVIPLADRTAFGE
jgi:hypothetical protein